MRVARQAFAGARCGVLPVPGDSVLQVRSFPARETTRYNLLGAETFG
jgi:hypothetical protein